MARAVRAPRLLAPAALAGVVLALAGCGGTGAGRGAAVDVADGPTTTRPAESTTTTTVVAGSEARVPAAPDAPVLDPPGRPGGSGPLGPDLPDLPEGPDTTTTTTVAPFEVSSGRTGPTTTTAERAARDDAGTRRVDASDLEVGMCFLEPGSSQVAVLEVVDCARSHDHEVVALWLDSSPAGAAFPGRAALLADADCLGKLAAYSGVDPLVAGLDALPITPEAATWAAGDRAVGCYASNFDRSPRTGSLAAP